MNDVTAKQSGGPLAQLSSLKAGMQTAAAQIQTSGGGFFLTMQTDGVWAFGAEKTEVDKGTRWAVNPLSVQQGFVAWTNRPKGNKNELMGKQMVPITSDLETLRRSLPAKVDQKFEECEVEWKEAYQIDLVCTEAPDKEDVGVAVIYETSSVGGKNAMQGLLQAIVRQLDVDANQCTPILELGSEHYNHGSYGKTYTPVLEIVGWAGLNDTTVAEIEQDDEPEPEAEPEAEPVARSGRRRRQS